MEISSSASSTTTILDLVDDCLIAVFQHLHITDLGGVADVCTRFRQNAQIVAESKLKDVLPLDAGKSSDNPLIESARVLRNFGAHAQSMHVYNSLHYTLPQSEIEEKLFQLLSLHCSGTVNELKIDGIIITDEIATIMQPLLRRLQKLELESSVCGKELSQKLPLIAPLLRELKLIRDRSNFNIFNMFGGQEEGKRNLFMVLHRTFPKLESIFLRDLDYVMCHDVNKFLAQNPQLRKIEISGCDNLTRYELLQSIAENVPEIESIHIIYKIRLFIPFDHSYNFFGRLRKLNALTLNATDDYIAGVVGAIGASGIALEHLDFKLLNLISTKLILVDGISKLKTLKTLRLEIWQCTKACVYFFPCDILEICKSLSDLSELHLSNTGCIFELDRLQKVDWSGELLLELIRNAEKLEVFKFRCKNPKRTSGIDADIYMRMVKVVESRREKKLLKLDLPENFTVNVPPELAAANKHLLQVITEKRP